VKSGWLWGKQIRREVYNGGGKTMHADKQTGKSGTKMRAPQGKGELSCWSLVWRWLWWPCTPPETPSVSTRASWEKVVVRGGGGRKGFKWIGFVFGCGASVYRPETPSALRSHQPNTAAGDTGGISGDGWERGVGRTRGSAHIFGRGVIQLALGARAPGSCLSQPTKHIV
jgi:hypothetical protein